MEGNGLSWTPDDRLDAAFEATRCCETHEQLDRLLADTRWHRNLVKLSVSDQLHGTTLVETAASFVTMARSRLGPREEGTSP